MSLDAYVKIMGTFILHV